MKYKESTSKKVSIDKINSLRLSVGWPKRRTDRKWKEILSKSSFVYTLWDKDKLIGMGRILEDGVMCMFYDIVVDRDYQGKGLGKKIVKKMLDQVNGKKYTSIGLFTNGKKNVEFYKKCGFEIFNVGMECKKHMSYK